jgi:hypothetical protein
VAISFIGSGTGITTAAIPAHVAGDLLLAWAFKDGSATIPTLGSGFTSVLTGTLSTTASFRLAYRIATASGTSSGSWTNATGLIISVYRPGSGNTISLGATQWGSASATLSIYYPGITLQNTSGSSWVTGFAGISSVNTNLETSGTGLTRRATYVDATNETVVYDTNGGVTSWSAGVNTTLTGTAGNFLSTVVEIKETYPTITGLSSMTEADDTISAASTIGSGGGGGHGWDPTANGVTLSTYNSVANALATGDGVSASYTGFSTDTITSGQKKYYENVWVGGISGAPSTNYLFNVLDIAMTNGVTGTLDGNYADGALTASGSLGTLVVGDNIGIAVDNAAGKVWIRKNGGSWYGASGTAGAGSPTSGTDGISIPAGTTYYAFTADFSSGSTVANGLKSSNTTYTPPSGYLYLDGTTPSAGPITGTSSMTEAGDTSASTGTVAVKAASTPTEAGDTMASTGTITLKGLFGVTEANDTSTSAATITLKATSTVTEAGDTLSATSGAPASSETMWDHSITTYSGTENSDFGNGQNLTLGVVFSPVKAGFITHISFWKTSIDTATSRTVALYNSSGTMVASGTSSSEPTGTAQWVEVALSSPYAVSAAAVTTNNYTAAVYYAQERYPATSSVFTAGMYSPTSAFYFLSSTEAVGKGFGGNGLFVYDTSGAIAPPTGAFGNGNYWIDVKWSGSGSSSITGTLSATESGDTSSSTAGLAILGTSSSTEGGDTVVSATINRITGTTSQTEGDDTVSVGVSKLLITGLSSMTDADDTLSSTSKIAIAAAFGVTEAGDTTSALAALLVKANASITESGDTLSASNINYSLWTPSIISSDLTTWVKADAISVSNGSYVTVFTDSGPDGRSFSKIGTNGVTYTTNAVNGLPAFYMNNEPMVSDDTAISFGDFGVYLVVKGVTSGHTAGGTERLIDHNYDDGFWLGRGDTAGSTNIGGGVKELTSPYGVFVPMDTTTYHVLTTERIGTTHHVQIDGGAYTASNTVTSAATLPSVVRIGSDKAGMSTPLYNAYDTYIAEIVIIDANVSANGDEIEGYLAWKYGLQAALPSGHTYKLAPPYLSAPPITGTLTATEAADSVSSTSFLSIKGSLNLTDADDTSSGTAVTTRKASASLTEADDTLVTIGGPKIVGNSASTEGGDTVSATANIGSNYGSVTITEADDALVFATKLSNKANASIVEEDDTLLSVGIQPILGLLSLTEDADGIICEARHDPIAASSFNIEADDTISATSTMKYPTIQGFLARSDDDDTLTTTTTSSRRGQASVTEGDDILTVRGGPKIVANASGVEGNDTSYIVVRRMVWTPVSGGNGTTVGDRTSTSRRPFENGSSATGSTVTETTSTSNRPFTGHTNSSTKPYKT